MIAPLLLMAAVFEGPEAAPALEAVKRCDRGAMQALTKAEPHRRSQFAAAAYAEQQSIARDRADLLARQAKATVPADQAAIAASLAALDARQRQLEDARAVEISWRALVDELRTDFLANCMQGK
ncbi:hypothetical protein [Novosphingobium sp.]|uniref:hypothetical protein n=1 Tax=Novosphingobium sp. TaxID=1874826 RepID=UPI0035B47FE5